MSEYRTQGKDHGENQGYKLTWVSASVRGKQTWMRPPKETV